MRQGTTNVDQPGGGEVMTLAETARYLKLSERTILRMLKAGKIPAVKMASQWRFTRTALEEWLAAGMQSVSRSNLIGIIRTTNNPIPISQLISTSRIILDMAPGGKEHVLRQLVDPLRRENILADADEFLLQLLARERMVSTAIGHGVAIPHVRNPKQTGALRPCIVLGVCGDGTEFQSLDQQPTYVFALICSSAEDVQLRLMAKVSLLLRTPRIVSTLRQTRSKRAVMSLVEAADGDIGIAGQMHDTGKGKKQRERDSRMTMGESRIRKGRGA